MEAVRPLEKGLEYKSFSSDKGDEMKRSSSFSLDKRSFNLRLVERFGSEQLSSFQSEAERVMQDGSPTARETDETKNKQQVMFPSRAAKIRVGVSRSHLLRDGLSGPFSS